MKRKVNLVGQNTLTVSLPSKWVEKNGIKKGDEVEIEDNGKEVTIGLRNTKITRELTFKIENPEQLMNRTMYGPYLRGYSSITYYYDNPVVYSRLLGSVKKMLGFEIIEQTQQKCKIAEVTEGSNQNFSKLMLRLFFILKSYTLAVQRFLQKPTKDYNEFTELELECDKISLYCRRLININYLHGPIYDSTAFYYTLCAAEQIGDELDDIIDYYRNNELTKYKYDTALDPMFKDLELSLDTIFKKIDNYLDSKDEDKRTECDIILKKYREDIKIRYKKIFNKKDTNIIALHIFKSMNLIKHMSEELY